ncbi:MAG: putative toxin-antitoxin system toxin component, PIN family [Saprospiraceae bacterium]
MNIILDTNILVRAISSRSFSSWVFDALFDGKYDLFVSTDILLEYHEILTKIYDAEIADLVTGSIILLPNVYRTEVYFDMRLISVDMDDNKFVNCAFASNADYIVSDDKHFSILKNIAFPKINSLSYLILKN